MFLGTRIPDEINSRLRPVIEKLFGESTVVVRSSAIGEDSEKFSFAGIHESYVNVRGADAIIKHIKLVWASLFSDAAILYLHGGGFIMGSPATHRELAARVSSAGGACVLSLGYRLLPEYPFPAALDDARTAYRWLLERGYASDQLIIGGDSSGAGLALQTLISLRDEGVPLPCAGFFMSPVTDWVEPGGESFATRAALDSLVSPAQCRQTSSMYVASHGDSPLLRPTETNLAGLPPLWIQVGDHEVLLSDAERLADRAAEAGVEVDFKIWPGMWHVFQSAAQYVPESRQSIEELGLFLQRRLGRRPSLPCNQAENRTTFEPTIVRANVFEEEPAAK